MSLSIISNYIASSSFTRLFSIDNNLSVKLKLIDSLGSGLTKQMVNNGVSPSDALLLVYDITKYIFLYSAKNLFIDWTGGWPR